MTTFLGLGNASAAHVHDGDVLAMEGLSHLTSFAAGHEVIRQGRRDLADRTARAHAARPGQDQAR